MIQTSLYTFYDFIGWIEFLILLVHSNFLILTVTKLSIATGHATILDKIVGTLSNLMIKFHVPCKNVAHHPPSPAQCCSW